MLVSDKNLRRDLRDVKKDLPNKDSSLHLLQYSLGLTFKNVTNMPAVLKLIRYKNSETTLFWL